LIREKTKTIGRILLSIVIILLLFSFNTFAHSGRTDSNGGHRDNKNASGLGYYHYHHGYGPHLHPNGVCPYETPEETTIPEPVYVSSVMITPMDNTVLEVGDETVLSATISPSDAENKFITWSSSDINVAIVSENGIVTAANPGSAIITAKSSNGKTNSITLNVDEKAEPVSTVTEEKASSEQETQEMTDANSDQDESGSSVLGYGVVAAIVAWFLLRKKKK
jgi:hypothetical protein